ncbi:OmpA/MotB family protein [Geopsychrobacter electrodiphilus]|uniref:OmpA/MotB family protein n=1 Tax=Geopsychrobacter electrodiphilus TaxID=225196 RepID=UPI00036B22B1|nr:OmpA family protein [Geopsychrobacter electrodiphilus]
MKKLGYLSLMLLLASCVSQGTFDLKANEATQLSQNLAEANNRIKTLETLKQQGDTEISGLNTKLIAQLKKNSELQQTLLNERADLDRSQQTFSSRQEQMQEQLQEMNQNNQELLTSIAQLQQEQNQLKEQVAAERKARDEKVASLKNTYDQLVGALEQEIKRGELTITNLKGKLSVNLPNKILFDSGKTEVRPEGKKVLRSLGDIMTKFPDKALLVEGHTDNVQISSRLKETYPTNWELSTARANSVVHVLQDEVGLPGERLVAAGYSEYRPVADNSTAEGRAFNRRIQIQLVPMPGTE